MESRRRAATHLALASLGLLMGGALACLWQSVRPVPREMWLRYRDMDASRGGRGAGALPPARVFLSREGAQSTLLDWRAGGWTRPRGSSAGVVRLAGVARRAVLPWMDDLGEVLQVQSEFDTFPQHLFNPSAPDNWPWLKYRLGVEFYSISTPVGRFGRKGGTYVQQRLDDTEKP